MRRLESNSDGQRMGPLPQILDLRVPIRNHRRHSKTHEQHEDDCANETDQPAGRDRDANSLPSEMDNGSPERCDEQHDQE